MRVDKFSGQRDLKDLQREIINCRQCPRLVAWREKVSMEKVSRFAGEEYWGRPLPGFGDPEARLLIVGLAPAAHGGNRTGRMFTGDSSGDWLYRALHKAGFANQAISLNRDDGLKLTDCFITAAVRCAPPQNRPEREEIVSCHNFLVREIKLFKNLRLILGLGKIGFDNALKAAGEVYNLHLTERLKFAHGAEYKINSSLTLLASFHPSQQNTFTKRLTEEMFDKIFCRTKELLSI